MTYRNPHERRISTMSLLVACVSTLGVVFSVALPRAAQIDRPDRVSVPNLPEDLRVDPPHVAVRVAPAVGTQNYVCQPSGGGLAWVLFTPQATLFRKEAGQQVITHFFSPNPVEGGLVRAAWQHSRDSSTFWGKVSKISTDENFVAEGAIAWLLLEKAGDQEGPTGGDQMTDITFIQRVNTVGGLAPSTGCSVAADIGSKAFMPYRADYIFYEDPTRTPADEK